jgi:peptidoglycan LD-endopeptidase CwlK
VDKISEDRLALVHPELARRVRMLSDKCEAAGISIRVTCGLRTYDEQQELWDQGRSDPGQIVTNAMPGYSWHNFGLAVDIAPGIPGGPAFKPDWNEMDPQWKQVLTLALTCQLSEGAVWRTFPDFPHLYPEELMASPNDYHRQLYAEGGEQMVFANLNLNEVKA